MSLGKRNTVERLPASDKLRIYRTGLYGRLSVLDNGKVDGDSLESQVALMEAYVSERPYLEYAKLYQDNGYTGTNFQRPAWEELMRDVRAGSIDCILVKDLSRLGRNYIETGAFLEKECPALGVRFISINDGYDSLDVNANDALTAALKNIVNDFYAKDISRKVCTALAIKRERGEYVGSYAPYGYQRDPADRSHLVPDPETAPIVLQIYQWRAEKMGYGAITRRLNEQGVSSPGRYRYEHGIFTNNNKRGAGLLWNRHVLSDILRNPVYLGHLAQGRRRACLYQGIREHAVPETEWDISRNTHEAIVPEPLYLAVQTYNEQQKRIYHGNYGRHSDLPKRANPYGAKLTCPDCGKQLKLNRYLASDGKRAWYAYVCPTFLEHREKGCSRKFIRADDLDAAILETLRLQLTLFLDDAAVLHALMQEKTYLRVREHAEADRAFLLRRKERKRTLLASLYGDWKSGVLTEEEYRYGKKKYTEEMERLSALAAEAEARQAFPESCLRDAGGWIDKLEACRNCDTLSKDMVDALIDGITLDGAANIAVRFRFDDARRLLEQEIKRLREEVT